LSSISKTLGLSRATLYRP